MSKRSRRNRITAGKETNMEVGYQWMVDAGWSQKEIEEYLEMEKNEYEEWRGGLHGPQGALTSAWKAPEKLSIPIPQPSKETIDKVRKAFKLADLQLACNGTPEQWFDWYRKNKPGCLFKSPDGMYVYNPRKGAKILAMGHLDSVQSKRGVVDDRAKDGRIYSPVLDDRLGIYTIHWLLPALGINVSLLLLDEEETGNSTAKQFCLPQSDQYNWMVEFDRKGEDVVTYGFNEDTWRSSLKKHFDYGYGTFSDISSLEHVGVSGANVGVGYENYHGLNAYFDFEVYVRQIARFVEFYNEFADTTFGHKEAPPAYTYTGYTGPSTVPGTVRYANGKKEVTAYRSPKASAIGRTPPIPSDKKPQAYYDFKTIYEDADLRDLLFHLPKPGSIGRNLSIAEGEDCSASLTIGSKIEEGGAVIFSTTAKAFRAFATGKDGKGAATTTVKNYLKRLNAFRDGLTTGVKGELPLAVQGTLRSLIPYQAMTGAPGLCYESYGYKPGLMLYNSDRAQGSMTFETNDYVYCFGFTQADDDSLPIWWVERNSVAEGVMAVIEKEKGESTGGSA